MWVDCLTSQVRAASGTMDLPTKRFTPHASSSLPSPTFSSSLASMRSAFCPSRLDFRFFLLRLVQGVGFSAFYISNLTIVADMVPESRRGEAVGLFGISGLITIALSPALGEQFIQVAGFPAFFLAAAAAAAAALLVSLALRDPKTVSQASVELSLSTLIPSMRIMPPIVLSFVFGAGSGRVFLFLPPDG